MNGFLLYLLGGLGLRTPVVNKNDRYKFRHDDPFNETIVTVIEVKDGWVKYAFKSGNESTLPLYKFNSFYSKQ